MNRHKAKQFTYRLPLDLQAQWEEFLTANELPQNGAVKNAIEAYIFNYYPQQKGEKKDV